MHRRRRARASARWGRSASCPSLPSRPHRMGRASVQADHRICRDPPQRLADPEERANDPGRDRQGLGSHGDGGAATSWALRIWPHRREACKCRRAGRAPRRQHEYSGGDELGAADQRRIARPTSMCFAAEPVPHRFHARHDAVARRSACCTSRLHGDGTAFAKPFVWWVREPLRSQPVMQHAAASFVGFRDFQSFAESDDVSRSGDGQEGGTGRKARRRAAEVAGGAGRVEEERSTIVLVESPGSSSRADDPVLVGNPRIALLWKMARRVNRRRPGRDQPRPDPRLRAQTSPRVVRMRRPASRRRRPGRVPGARSGYAAERRDERLASSHRSRRRGSVATRPAIFPARPAVPPVPFPDPRSQTDGWTFICRTTIS